MINKIRPIGLVLIAVALLVALPAVNAGSDRHLSSALPVSGWWLVTHDQCADTLHWINPSGEYAAIPRPKLPNESPSTACSYKPLHISQNGRYLVEIATLNSGRVGVGFYDLQTAAWLQIHEADPDERAYLGARYSSDAHSRIAISFATQTATVHAWRVIIFDMATGSLLDQLRSDGTEIASFVGAEFLASASTIPYVVLMAQDEATTNDQIHIRFDGVNPGDAPLGAAAWYPAGAPGVSQELISSGYREKDISVLPNGHAIYAYSDPGYPAGPPAGESLVPITTNAIALMQPDTLGPSPDSQLFFADGVSTLYDGHWGADGRIVLFRRADTAGSMMYWIKLGTAVLTPLEQVAQVIDVPTGFIYNTADGIYFLSETATAPTGPIYSNPALSGQTAFVWASPFGNPPLALDTLGTGILPIATPSGPGVIIVTATPDSGVCRVASADGTNINVRSGPGTNYPTIGQMNGAAELNVTGVNGQWYVVNFSGVQGWLAGWVTTLKGNCTGLTFVTAPPVPPTPVPTGPVIEFWTDRASISAGECVNISWHVENISQVYYQSAGVVGDGTRNECPAATTTYTLSVLLTDGTTQTRTVTITVGGGGGGAQPDLYISEFHLDPATPVEGQPVQVRVGVYNGGDAAISGTSFHVEWYPGENYPSPACSWDLNSLPAHGGYVQTCTYAGYPSWYGSINTKVVVDTGNAVAESNEGNNTYLQPISVTASGGGGGGQPDLYVSEFSLNPSTPVQGQPVQVRVGVYNKGTASVSGTSFHIDWYPGENYPSPACSWDLDSMSAGGGRILTCTYAGYPSWYGSINTKVVVDTANAVAESNEGNNSYTQGISVSKP